MTSHLFSLLRRSTRRRTYAALLDMDERLLRDIGLSRFEITEMLAGRRARI